MFTAIKMFIRESLQLGGELKNIEHGDYKILIEGGKEFYLAVIGKGEDITSFRGKMKNTISRVQKNYGAAIKKWNGDVKVFDGIEDDLSELIN